MEYFDSWRIKVLSANVALHGSEVVSCGDEIQFDFKVAPRGGLRHNSGTESVNLALILLIDILTYGSN